MRSKRRREHLCSHWEWQSLRKNQWVRNQARWQQPLRQQHWVKYLLKIGGYRRKVYFLWERLGSSAKSNSPFLLSRRSIWLLRLIPKRNKLKIRMKLSNFWWLKSAKTSTKNISLLLTPRAKTRRCKKWWKYSSILLRCWSARKIFRETMSHKNCCWTKQWKLNMIFWMFQKETMPRSFSLYKWSNMLQNQKNKAIQRWLWRLQDTSKSRKKLLRVSLSIFSLIEAIKTCKTRSILLTL